MFIKIAYALTLVTLLQSSLLAQETPKELKKMIGDAYELISKKKYLEFFKLVMHPDIKKGLEETGMTMEQIAEELGRNEQKCEMFVKLFAAFKDAKTCKMNEGKTEATFDVPKELEEVVPVKSIQFALHDKKWYLFER